MGRLRRKTYDPISRKMVEVKPLKQQMGGPVTRNGQPVDPQTMHQDERFIQELPDNEEQA